MVADHNTQKFILSVICENNLQPSKKKFTVSVVTEWDITKIHTTNSTQEATNHEHEHVFSHHSSIIRARLENP